MDKTHELHTRDCTSFTRLRCRQLKMALKLNVTVPKNCDTEQTKTKTELQAALQPSLPPPEDYGTTSCVEGKWITFCLAKSPW